VLKYITNCQHKTGPVCHWEFQPKTQDLSKSFPNANGICFNPKYMIKISCTFLGAAERISAAYKIQHHPSLPLKIHCS